jgi:hypothetical protein
MCSPFDLHASSTPPAFVLSQDQTLQVKLSNHPGHQEAPRADESSTHRASRPMRAGYLAECRRWTEVRATTSGFRRFGAKPCALTQDGRSSVAHYIAGLSKSRGPRPETKNRRTARATGSRRALEGPKSTSHLTNGASAVWLARSGNAISPGYKEPRNTFAIFLLGRSVPCQ